MLDTMFETVGKAVATGRPGTPVAARLLLEIPSSPTDLAAELAAAADRLSTLFGSPVESIDVFGSLDKHQLSGLVRFAEGQSALLSVAAAQPAGRGECVVFADRGTLHWEAAGDDVRLAETKPSADDPAKIDWQSRIVTAVAELPVTRPARPFPEPPVPQGAAPPYGVLLVSGDHTHQPGYAAALAADPRCRLVAVSDEAEIPEYRLSKNHQLATRLGLPYLADLDEALARDDVAVVSVCAEPYRRGRIIARAARAGKHLYLDKPLCATMAEADAMVAAVRDAGVVAHMFSQVWFDPAQAARRHLASGGLGELLAIHSDLCFAKGHAGTASLGRRRVESPQPSRFELPEAKREMTNVGIYNLVLLLWLVRRSVCRVSASTGNYFFAEHQAHDMEDFGQLLLEFEGGLTATISAGRLGWQSHPSSGLNKTYLVGSRRSVVVDAHRERVEMWTAAPAWQPPSRNPEDPMGMWQAPPGDPYQAEPKQDWIVPGSTSWQIDSGYFLDCLEQGRASEVSIELAAAATEVLLAAYRSAATGKPVDLSS